METVFMHYILVNTNTLNLSQNLNVVKKKNGRVHFIAQYHQHNQKYMSWHFVSVMSSNYFGMSSTTVKNNRLYE